MTLQQAQKALRQMNGAFAQHDAVLVRARGELDRQIARALNDKGQALKAQILAAGYLLTWNRSGFFALVTK